MNYPNDTATQKDMHIQELVSEKSNESLHILIKWFKDNNK